MFGVFLSLEGDGVWYWGFGLNGYSALFLYSE